MTNLLSPSCFSGMFPFTFLDSFLIKASSAFSFSASQSYRERFQQMYLRDQLPPYLVPLWLPLCAFIECVRTEARDIPGNFSANFFVFSSSLGFSPLLDQPLLSHLLSHFQVSLLQVMKVSYLLQSCHLFH